MSDPKYRAGNVPCNEAQMVIIEQAMDKFRDENGIMISRSQMLTALAHWYVKGSLTKEGKTNGDKG